MMALMMTALSFWWNMKTRSYSFTIFFLFIFSVLIPHSSMANILRLEKWNFKKYSSTLEGPWTEISDRKSKDFKGEGTRFEKGLKTYQLLISLPKYLENF